MSRGYCDGCLPERPRGLTVVRMLSVTVARTACSMTERHRLRLESKKRKLNALANLILHEEVDSVQPSKRSPVDNKESDADGNMLAGPTSSPGIAWRQKGAPATGIGDGTRTVMVPSPEGSESKRDLTDEEVAALKARIRARQKAAMMLPKLFLDMDAIADEYYKNQLNEGPRPADAALPPLFLMDVQHLLLFALMGKLSSYRPRWCQLLRVTKVTKVVLAVVDGLGSATMAQCAEHGSFVGANFDVKVEVVQPHIYGAVCDDELFKVPLTGRKLVRKRSGEKKLVAHLATDQQQQHAQRSSPAEDSAAGSQEAELVSGSLPSYLRLPEVVPRTELLLNWSQLIQEGYPLGLVGRAEYAGFVYTKSRYSKVTDSSPMYAIDCEMCRTTAHKQELTRVSVVDENLRCIYDTFVKPRNAITDYLTQFSGITKEILQDVTTRIEDVQKELQRILPSDAILVGQSLNNDLFALKVFHPYCVDTSVVFNLRGFRHTKTGLKKLMAHFLGKTIQDAGPQGHNSIEDARSAMELVLLKLRCGIDYGDAAVGGSLDPLAFVQQMNGAKHMAAASGTSDGLRKTDVTEQPAAVAADSGFEQGPQSDDGPQAILSKDVAQRRKARFLYRSLDMYDDFFELLGRCGKEAGMVASERICRLHKQSRFLEVVVEEKNRETTKHAIDVASRKHFTYVRYWAGRGEPSKLHRKTERRIKKIYTSLPVGSLLVVLLLPSSDGPSHNQQNAVCCATLRKECPATIGGQSEASE